MKFDENCNYTVLANNADKNFLRMFSSYRIFDSKSSFEELLKSLEFCPNKQVVFCESFYNLRNKEKVALLKQLHKQGITFINITTNIEDSLFGDRIMVFDENKLILEDTKEIVLKNEKILKKLGYGLPFSVDLSIQLNYYDILKKVYYDIDEMVNVLWN